MDYSKYKNLLFKKIQQQLSQWFDSDDVQFISNNELFRFMHSLKGSAGTFKLGGLFQLADSLLEKINDRKEKPWGKDELKVFLYDLISLASEYETFNEIETEKPAEYQRDNKIPLIQIIDDDISMLILLKDALEEKGWMVIANTSPEKAIAQYYDVSPDVVIIDVHMPNKNGVEILEDLEKHTGKMFVPKIMISAANDRKTRMRAFRKGADDFIEKPIDVEELIVRIERHLHRKNYYDHSVLLDELTNLYNRRFLKDLFNRNLSDLSRHGQPFSIAILDLDHFKNINDSYGHLVGDKVLAEFASFLKGSIRTSDTVFRYGGEEFVILFPNTDLHAAIEIVKRLLEVYAEKQFTAKGENFSITFSGGIHTVMTRDETLESALSIADQALYKAKESGRAKVESMNESLPEYSKRKLFISVIDDDALIRAMLTRILQSMVIDHYEINVEVFENGVKFFDSNRLKERGEHFLILDGVMPVMDGLEILQKVKQQRYEHNILVLMLTGRKNEADIARALKYGADDYITKPFSITELQARIERLIQRVK